MIFCLFQLVQVPPKGGARAHAFSAKCPHPLVALCALLESSGLVPLGLLLTVSDFSLVPFAQSKTIARSGFIPLHVAWVIASCSLPNSWSTRYFSRSLVQFFAGETDSLFGGGGIRCSARSKRSPMSSTQKSLPAGDAFLVDTTGFVFVPE